MPKPIIIILITTMLAVAGANGDHREDPRRTPAIRAERPTADLLGISADEILMRLGPPVEVVAGAHLTNWIYLGRDGMPLENGVWIAGDHAIRVDEGVVVPEAHVGKPESGAYLGQPVRELVSRLGQPGRETSIGQFSVRLAFDAQAVSIADGRVVHLVGDR